jgi:hypothetical protein
MRRRVLLVILPILMATSGEAVISPDLAAPTSKILAAEPDFDDGEVFEATAYCVTAISLSKIEIVPVQKERTLGNILLSVLGLARPDQFFPESLRPPANPPDNNTTSFTTIKAGVSVKTKVSSYAPAAMSTWEIPPATKAIFRLGENRDSGGFTHTDGADLASNGNAAPNPVRPDCFRQGTWGVWRLSIEYISDQSARITFSRRKERPIGFELFNEPVPPFKINLYFKTAQGKEVAVEIDPFGHNVPKIQSQIQLQIHESLNTPRRFSFDPSPSSSVENNLLVFVDGVIVPRSSSSAVPAFIPLRI